MRAVQALSRGRWSSQSSLTDGPDDGGRVRSAPMSPTGGAGAEEGSDLARYAYVQDVGVGAFGQVRFPMVEKGSRPCGAPLIRPLRGTTRECVATR